MSNRATTFVGFLIVTIAEVAGLWFWLSLQSQGHPTAGFVCLLLGEGIEWILLTKVVASSELSLPRKTGRVPQAILILGAIAVAEAVLWVVWLILIDKLGVVPATTMLFVIMHAKHVGEIGIVTGRRYSQGLLGAPDVIATLAEAGGAAIWFVLFSSGYTTAALAVLFVSLGIEHYLQFMVGGLVGRRSLPPSHEFLVIAIPFPDEHAESVENQLDALGNPATEEVRDALRGRTIHFMSLNVLRGGKKHATFLVLEGSFDRTEESAQVKLADCFGDCLRKVLGSAGINVSGTEDLVQLLDKHSQTIEPGLFSTVGLNFTGTPGMSADRIRQEFNLARKVRGIVEEGIKGTPLQVLRAVRAQIEADSEFKALLTADDVTLLQPPGEEIGIVALIAKGALTFLWLPMLVAALVVGATIVWMVPLAGLGLALLTGFVVLLVELVGFLLVAPLIYRKLRRLEQTDLVDERHPDLEVLAEVIRRENATEQNHLNGISELKPGIFRRLTLQLVFWAIAQVSQTQRPGFLGALGTIHFARWILLPGTNKLLFFSNYGGSWESYLEDFITKSHNGLTGVWSNTVGFPRTRNIFQDGATDGDRFKRWARRYQQPTRFWYSAYPHLTTERIRINAAIRHGLATATLEDQAATWLSCIGSRPRPPETIETGDVQKIVFGGLGPLAYAQCLLIRFPEEQPAARAWLADVENELSFGEGPVGECARIVGLTQSGLARLLPDQTGLQAFPTAFQQGMSVDHRARLLRDTGDDKPEQWWWGYGQKSVDAVLLLYHRSQEGCDRDVSRQIERLTGRRGQLIHKVVMQVVDQDHPTREPFGFVDGVSQPMIRGTRLWTTDSDPLHVVAPGEFILGYPDDRGLPPDSPTVPASMDRACYLPALQRNLSDSSVPAFESNTPDDVRDLGRNGSFLVIRQLEQDVDLFNSFISQIAQELIRTPRPGALPVKDQRQMEEWVAAKMVGRWRDGTSLIRFQDHPGNGWPWEQNVNIPKVEPDNSFSFGSEDPLGYRCPFGAHIRRTNPRDSLFPGSADQIAISNRHRILRVGRPYGPESQTGAGPAKPGLLFMCLNASIERQFEFIQQTWAMARLFHGLDGEVDSIIGRGLKGGRLSIPTTEGPILIKGIRDFVRVRGGAYFFLPSHRAIRFLSSSLDDATTDFRSMVTEQAGPIEVQ